MIDGPARDARFLGDIFEPGFGITLPAEDGQGGVEEGICVFTVKSASSITICGKMNKRGG